MLCSWYLETSSLLFGWFSFKRLGSSCFINQVNYLVAFWQFFAEKIPQLCSLRLIVGALALTPFMQIVQRKVKKAI